MQRVHRLNSRRGYISLWLIGDDFPTMKCCHDRLLFVFRIILTKSGHDIWYWEELSACCPSQALSTGRSSPSFRPRGAFQRNLKGMSGSGVVVWAVEDAANDEDCFRTYQ